MMRVLPLCAAALSLTALACTEPAPRPVASPPVTSPPVTSPPVVDENGVVDEDALVARLRAFEEKTRAETEFDALPPWSEVSGSDPGSLARLGDEVATLWRGDARVTFADGRNFEVPRGARRLVARGDALVTAGADTVVVFRMAAVSGVVKHRVPGALELVAADLGADGKTLYAVDARLDRLFVLHESGEVLARFPTCRRPLQVQRGQGALFVRCLLDHKVQRHPLDDAGLPQPGAVDIVEHNGPIWAMELIEREGATWLVLAGVEDEPLDRTIGSFGSVDSFAFLYEVVAPSVGGPAATRLGLINLGELKVITPKAVRATEAGVWIAGPAGPKAALLRASKDGLKLIETRSITPGAVDLLDEGRDLLLANPLFDKVRRAAADGETDVALGRPAAGGWQRRVGEALFFTHLMAPPQKTEGKLSRFTCETCHFEGEVDGRIHHTGRGEVQVSTKTLRGLFNNRPHFSRALDESMAKMVHAEFRVAHDNSEVDPVLPRTLADFPWLAELGAGGTLSPEDQRRALMSFLMGFTHEANPAVRGREAFNDEERRGAALFRDRCLRCHAARLVSEDEAEVPFAQWEKHVFGRGAILWGRSGYEKTGVTPYVHKKGARVPSLRRVSRKWPLLTTGVAKNLDEVLLMSAWEGERFFHAGAPTGAQRLSAAERRGLAAFLELL